MGSKIGPRIDFNVHIKVGLKNTFLMWILKLTQRNTFLIWTSNLAQEVTMIGFSKFSWDKVLLGLIIAHHVLCHSTKYQS
jgi:hypothetical protein